MDMEALVLQSQAAYKGFEERGMAVLRAQRERPVHPLATVLRLVDLFPQFAAQLKREGASDYQAHLAAEAARISWYAHTLRLAAAGNPAHKQLQAMALTAATELTEGRLFTNVVRNLAHQFGHSEPEVEMCLRQLVRALLPKANPE